MEYQFQRHRSGSEPLLSLFPEVTSQTFTGELTVSFNQIKLILAEVIKDTAEMVRALQESEDLQSKFISTLTAPHRDLMRLSREVSQY